MNAVRNDLGVGFRAERIAVALEFGAQLLMILDDAVVHDRKAILGDVWMRVALARHAVRGPAGVRDTERAVAGRALERILERLNLANRPQAGQVMGIIDDGDARGVVPPIFEPAQSFHQDGNDIALGDCSDNSTHALQTLVAARERRPEQVVSILV
jgi:hypothetical protein